MVAPVASFIQLPVDTTNTGKKVRTETKPIGSDTVHEHFYVPSVGMTIEGRYFFCSPQQSVSVTAHDGKTTGFFWIYNPVDSSITMVLRSIVADSNAGSVLATPTNPSINFSKGVYTGTPTGAALSSALPFTTGATTSQIIICTAPTGMTITGAAPGSATLDSNTSAFGNFKLPSSLTAIGPYYATKVVYAKNPLAYIRGLDLEFAPGEVLVVWQSTAGTTADTRKFTLQIEWDEVDFS